MCWCHRPPENASDPGVNNEVHVKLMFLHVLYQKRLTKHYRDILSKNALNLLYSIYFDLFILYIFYQNADGLV